MPLVISFNPPPFLPPNVTNVHFLHFPFHFSHFLLSFFQFLEFNRHDPLPMFEHPVQCSIVHLLKHPINSSLVFCIDTIDVALPQFLLHSNKYFLKGGTDRTGLSFPCSSLMPPAHGIAVQLSFFSVDTIGFPNRGHFPPIPPHFIAHPGIVGFAVHYIGQQHSNKTLKGSGGSIFQCSGKPTSKQGLHHCGRLVSVSS